MVFCKKPVLSLVSLDVSQKFYRQQNPINPMKKAICYEVFVKRWYAFKCYIETTFKKRYKIEKGRQSELLTSRIFI